MMALAKDRIPMIPASIRDLMKPPPGLDIDFTTPPGAPALVPYNGVSWKVFANPLTVFIGGIAAVLLELAEPSVRSGVWEHSNFRKDPVLRMRRTGFAALVTVYAAREKAEKMIAHVVRMHDRVTGTTPDGEPYMANDPRLLTWVHATALFGFIEAYSRYASTLSFDKKSAGFIEGQEAARLYGADAPPAGWHEWQGLFQATAPQLEDSAIITEFLDLVENAPILPAWLRPLQRLLVRAAVEMTPAPVRNFSSLKRRGLRPGEASIIRAMGRGTNVVSIPTLPPAQAARRFAIPAPAER